MPFLKLCGLIVAVDIVKVVAMNSSSGKLVFISIFGLFILIVLGAIVDKDQGTDLEGTYNTPQIHHIIRSHGLKDDYAYKRFYPPQQSPAYRTDQLRTKVKGYREFTYWGSEHPIDEEVR